METTELSLQARIQDVTSVAYAKVNMVLYSRHSRKAREGQYYLTSQPLQNKYKYHHHLGLLE